MSRTGAAEPVVISPPARDRWCHVDSDEAGTGLPDEPNNSTGAETGKGPSNPESSGDGWVTDESSVEITLPDGSTITETTSASGGPSKSTLRNRDGEIVRTWDSDDPDGFHTDETPEGGSPDDPTKPWKPVKKVAKSVNEPTGSRRKPIFDNHLPDPHIDTSTRDSAMVETQERGEGSRPGSENKETRGSQERGDRGCGCPHSCRHRDFQRSPVRRLRLDIGGGDVRVRQRRSRR